MALRNIVLEGDPILHKKAREVKEINDHVRLILDDMLETMRVHDGVGIAAPQVGVLRRMFIVELADQVYELINPEILETSGSIVEDEACLSLPGRVGVVERPAYVKIAGQDREGRRVEYEGEGLLAKAFCHEYDHLDGILYSDRAIEMRDVEGGEEE